MPGPLSVASLDVDPGETIDCTFTNDVAAPTPSAAFHIALDAVPDDPVDVAFSFVDHQFGFTLDDDPSDGTYANAIDIPDADVGTATYAATIPAGWQVKTLACVDPDNGSTTDPATAPMTLDLDDGETVSCTLTIEPIPAGPPPAPTCNGKAATILGGPGASTIRGTQGPDVIVDLDGDNRIDGRGGNDTICTGDGTDTVSGGIGDDWIATGAGDDRIDGGKGVDTCLPGTGSNTVRNCEG